MPPVSADRRVFGPAGPPEGHAPAVQVRDLAVRLGTCWALNDLSLTVPAGQILGVIGPNGAGKSTLINVIGGQLRPARGRVVVHGRDITGARPWQAVAAGVARTFQVPRVFPDMSARDNVAVGVLHGRYRVSGRRAVAALADELLEEVGFTAAPGTPPDRLGLADARRLELARALALRPSLLLLDELMAGLRPSEAEQCLDVLRRLRDSGMTILCVEHVLKIILAVSDQVLTMEKGRKLLMGAPYDVVGHPRAVESCLRARYGRPQGG
ncbi:ABC transporter ATP-binding protein [Actinomadura rubrobrunea]|uniref:ABC transporter ATP-binding protein n=1 Tax=Actinomadura rubrobrunea TaxID=115335 RepID=A0A9W6V077_9ACTN|nr:ABC transporter ATP-binding protein [Actinomadura rubrobrunea]